MNEIDEQVHVVNDGLQSCTILERSVEHESSIAGTDDLHVQKEHLVDVTSAETAEDLERNAEIPNEDWGPATYALVNNAVAVDVTIKFNGLCIYHTVFDIEREWIVFHNLVLSDICDSRAWSGVGEHVGWLVVLAN